MNPRDYLGVKVDEVKMKAGDTLSTTTATLLAWILLIAVAMPVIGVFSVAGLLLIGEAVDSYALGAVIVGGVLLIVLVILFLFRKKLFLKPCVRLFSAATDYEDLQRKEQANALMAAQFENDWQDGNHIALQVLRIFRKAFKI